MGSGRSHCIAIGRLYETSHSGRKRKPKSGSAPLVPLRSTFVIVVGVKTNRVRERSVKRLHKSPCCNKMRQHFSAIGDD